MNRNLTLGSARDGLLQALHEARKMLVSFSPGVIADVMDARRSRCTKARGHISYQFIEDTVVKLHLGPAAFPELVVVVLETLPVGLELVEAVGVDVLDAAKG